MHVSVMLEEMLHFLRPRSGGIYLDGTLGAGGYSEAILKASEPNGLVVGLDLDMHAVARASRRLEAFGPRFKPVHGGFHTALHILRELGIEAIDGAVLDLGLSSDQLEDQERGFSFQKTGPLDMRFDTSSETSAYSYLSNIYVKELEEILATYGEERYCKKLARGIIDAVRRGRIQTTSDLAQLVAKIYGTRREKIHPATRTFQALRIAVNRELDNLRAALNDLPPMLKAGGRLCVVSYHSLEDREVKVSFRERAKKKGGWAVLTPKPVRPSPEEVKANPRSRSAKLRALEALDDKPLPDGQPAGREKLA